MKHLNTYKLFESSYRVFYQHGGEDEGIIEIGISTSNSKDDIKVCIDKYTTDITEREYFYQNCRIQKI